MNKARTKFIWLFVLMAWLLVSPGISSAANPAWQELKGDHFIMYFQDNQPFAQDALSRAEKYYNEIAETLGYSRFTDFWTWDKRVKIYIYPDRNSYHAATGQRSWSSGVAYYKEKSIVSFAWSENFLDALLPHEIAHLIFRDHVGFKGDIPLWLDEGVAQWMEPLKRQMVQEAVDELAQHNKLLSLGKMLSLDVRSSQDEDMVRTFYIQSMSLVSFLIQEYGAEDFNTFCRQLRDGKSFEEALRFTYPSSIRGVAELEEQWHTYIRR